MRKKCGDHEVTDLSKRLREIAESSEAAKREPFEQRIPSNVRNILLIHRLDIERLDRVIENAESLLELRAVLYGSAAVMIDTLHANKS